MAPESGRSWSAAPPGVSSTPKHLDIELTFEGAAAAQTGLGSGAVIVFDDTTDFGPVLRRIAQFFRDESCGQCVPCRIGTVQSGGSPGPTRRRQPAGRHRRGATAARRPGPGDDRRLDLRPGSDRRIRGPVRIPPQSPGGGPMTDHRANRFPRSQPGSMASRSKSLRARPFSTPAVRPERTSPHFVTGRP